MTKKWLVGVICCAAALGVFFWQKGSKSADQAEELAQLRLRLEKSAEENRVLKEDVSRLKTERAEAEKARRANEEKILSKTALVDNPETTLKARRESLARLQRQKEVEVMIDYKPFFERVPPDKLDAFKKILLAEKVGLLEPLLEAQLSGASLRDQKELVTNAQADANSKIKDLLGSDGYQAYSDYTKAVPYVKAVDTISDRFYAANVPLSEDQRSALTSALISSPPPTAFKLTEGNSEQLRAAYAASLQSASDKFIANSSSILNQAQIKVLRDYENDQKGKALFTFNRLLRTARK